MSQPQAIAPPPPGPPVGSSAIGLFESTRTARPMTKHASCMGANLASGCPVLHSHRDFSCWLRRHAGCCHLSPAKGVSAGTAQRVMDAAIVALQKNATTQFQYAAAVLQLHTSPSHGAKDFCVVQSTENQRPGRGLLRPQL